MKELYCSKCGKRAIFDIVKGCLSCVSRKASYRLDFKGWVAAQEKKRRFTRPK